MALKMLIDSLEGVPEQLQDSYAKTEDGKFRLQVDGVEDPAALKRALQKEREARADFEKRLKAFDGLNVEELRHLQSQLENDEELKLVTQGKLPELRAKWVEKVQADAEKKLKRAADEVAEANKRTDSYRTRVLDTHIMQAAVKAGLHPHAVDDALLHGRQLFRLDDQGNPVQFNGDSVVLGKDGKTPYSPSEWLEGMREAKPHWFPASGTGSGAPASRGSGSNGQHRTMKRAQFDQLPAVEKSQVIKDRVQIVD